MNNPTGYSGKPLKEKLGYRTGMEAWVQNAPAWFAEELGITAADAEPGHAAYIHWFVTSRSELQALSGSCRLMPEMAMLWVSWPKKSSGASTDVTEQTLRDVLLPTGLVDVKVCAVDETWSGLKFVRRKKVTK